MRRRLLADERGAIAVETALTLPLLLLLTVGGLSVLWWLQNKAIMHLLVSEVARERAADATITGYVKDGWTAFVDPGDRFGLPNLRVLSFHLPLDPPLVMAAACAAPGGVVPAVPRLTPPERTGRTVHSGDHWLDGIRDVREITEGYLDAGLAWGAEAEQLENELVRLGEQLSWYKQVTYNLMQEREHQKRQAMDYLIGAGIEKGMALPCAEDAAGGTVLTAKAVIQGERTYTQR